MGPNQKTKQNDLARTFRKSAETSLDIVKARNLPNDEEIHRTHYGFSSLEYNVAAFSRTSVLVAGNRFHDQSKNSCSILYWQEYPKQFKELMVEEQILWDGTKFIPGVSQTPDLSLLHSQKDLLTFVPATEEHGVPRLPVFFPRDLRPQHFTNWNDFALRVSERNRNFVIQFELNNINPSNNSYYSEPNSHWAFNILVYSGTHFPSVVRFEGRLDKIFTRAMAFTAILNFAPEEAWDSLDGIKPIGLWSRDRSKPFHLHKSYLHSGMGAGDPTLAENMLLFSDLAHDMTEHLSVLCSNLPKSLK